MEVDLALGHHKFLRVTKQPIGHLYGLVGLIKELSPLPHARIPEFSIFFANNRKFSNFGGLQSQCSKGLLSVHPVQRL